MFTMEEKTIMSGEQTITRRQGRWGDSSRSTKNIGWGSKERRAECEKLKNDRECVLFMNKMGGGIA
jgi:hypothetical protein